MKILFCEGDSNCECEGTGWVYRTAKAPPDFDPDVERSIEKGDMKRSDIADDEIEIRIPCPHCTEFKEATLRVFDDEMDADITKGQVVPDD